MLIWHLDILNAPETLKHFVEMELNAPQITSIKRKQRFCSCDRHNQCRILTAAMTSGTIVKELFDEFGIGMPSGVQRQDGPACPFQLRLEMTMCSRKKCPS
jgi:hypothetical protein